MRKDSAIKKIIPHIIVGFVFLGVVIFFFWPFIIERVSFIWDTREFGFTNLYYVSSRLSELKFPLWNVHKFSGYPSAGDIELSMFYPIQWLFTLIFGAISFSELTYYFVFHFFLGAFSAYLLCYHFTKNYFASFMGGMVFAFSGYALGHLSHLGQDIMYMWIPLVFYAYTLALEKKKWFFTLFAGLIFGLAILVGHYNTSVYLLLGLFLLSVYRLVFFPDRVKTAIHALSATIFSILVASVLIFPVYELAMQSNRADLTYTQQSEGWSLSPSDLIGFIKANHNYVLDPNPLEKFNGSVDITQNYLYIGLLPLILILIGFFSANKYKYFFIIFGFISLLAAFGNRTPVNWVLFHGFPGFNKARMAVQIMCMVYLSASVMTALGAKKLFSFFNKLKLKKSLFLFGLIISTVVVSDVFYHGFDRGFYSEKINPNFVFDTQEELEIVSGIEDGDEIFRISDERRIFTPNKWEYYDVENVYGNSGIKIKKYNNLFKRLDRMSYMAITDSLYDFLNVKYLFINRNLPSSHFKKVDLSGEEVYLNLKMLPRAYLVENFIVEPDYEKQFELIKNNEINFANEVILDKEPIFYGSESNKNLDVKVEFLEKNSHYFELHTSSPADSILVLSEVDYDGWNLKVDGKDYDYFVANTVFRAVPLKAGEHIVEFTYRPLSVYIGAGISILAFLSFIVVSAIYIFGKRKVAK